MSEKSRLRIAFLWHMHQPFYFDPREKHFLMPWVRFHGLKDYLDMPLAAAEHKGARVTFNLVPSLLDQIQMYCDGCTDRHQELSRIPARHLSIEEKKEILKTFFAAHQANMIEPYARYRQLHRKRENCGSDISLAVETFSTTEWRDLQVWSNLVWIDPRFRKESPIRELLEKGRDFTEEEKLALMDFQMEILRRIIPTYKRLYDEKRIDVSFTPYYHPILPLLIDSQSAREALPQLSLPAARYAFPDDARWQVKASLEKYQNLFGGQPGGMWPSEGSVSEDVVRLLAQEGMKWIATDEELLQFSLLKSGLDMSRHSPHTAYAFAGAPNLKIFFRDRGLSDKIGFVYSGWESERAVNDFVLSLKRIRDVLKDRLERSLVPVILDGENAWEYFHDDGTEFLSQLYAAITADDQLEMVFLSDVAAGMEPTVIPNILAGSWINHNFRIWIGHPEDNAAWDFLSQTRKTLVEFEKKHPEFDREKIRQAWQQIYIAEGSDWFWWYGDEHQGADNDKFDHLFRRHLAAVYELLGLQPPPVLSVPLHREKGEGRIILPESLVTPTIDGQLTHYYEWSGAGHYDCLGVGGAMHRVDHVITGIHFAFDSDHFFIRLDFARRFDLVGFKNGRVIIDFVTLGPKVFPLEKGGVKIADGVEYCFEQLLEIKFPRSTLLPNGCGRVQFFVSLYSGAELLEKWPVDDPISLDIPEKDREIFWQV